MNYFIAGADLICALVSTILLSGILSAHMNRNNRIRYFFLSVLGMAVFSAIDAIAFLTDELGGNTTVRYIVNFLSYVGVDLILPMFVTYILLLVHDKIETVRTHILITHIACTLDFATGLYGTISGDLFRITEGKIEYGFLANYVGVVQILVSVYLLVLVFIKHKTIRPDYYKAIRLYVLIPVMAILTEFVIPGLSLAYATTGLIFVVVYISIVSEEIQSTILRERMNRTASITDAMTGLYNRRAYEEDIKIFNNNIPDDLIYIAMDVNELKIVNDSLGHESGDELLQGAATCISRCFGSYGRVYRLGGDEFATFFRATKEQFNRIRQDFDDTCDQWHGKTVSNLSISCGGVICESKSYRSFRELTAEADKRMYEAKSNHYRRIGLDRRGQKEAHTALHALYTKILKINISDDTYQIINMNPDEKKQDMGFSDKISAWIADFGKSGLVHPEDLEEYLAKTDLNYIRNYFMEEKTSLHIFYRRKIGDNYRQVMLEIIPAGDYSRNNQTFFLYVKNIDK